LDKESDRKELLTHHDSFDKYRTRIFQEEKEKKKKAPTCGRGYKRNETIKKKREENKFRDPCESRNEVSSAQEDKKSTRDGTTKSAREGSYSSPYTG